MSESVLYLIIAGCPFCNGENWIVEERDEPVNLMQDVGITRDHCECCGKDVPARGREWDVQEDAEIERVQPTEEREAAQDNPDIATDGGTLVDGIERGGLLRCGKCREDALWNEHREEYVCPECGREIA